MVEGRYRFGAHLVDAGSGRLSRDGADVPLQPLTWRLLLCLVQRPGAVLTHDELHGHLWPGARVTSSSLVQLVRRLRLALGPDGDLVQSLPRRGYRFDGAVTVEAASSARSNLRPAADVFVGRTAELGLLEERLAAGDRLVAVVGPPGVGKTRLAQELARREVARRDGVWTVDLAGVEDASVLATAIAAALGLAPDPSGTGAQLGLQLDGLGGAARRSTTDRGRGRTSPVTTTSNASPSICDRLDRRSVERTLLRLPRSTGLELRVEVTEERRLLDDPEPP